MAGGPGSSSTTMRARRVLYDDYTHAFFVESRLEALQRQVAVRGRLTEVLNRSQDTRLRDRTKRVEVERDIFQRKQEREALQHRELLKDHVAHRHVLSDIARSRGGPARPLSPLGLYGPGASKLLLQPLIQQTIKERYTPAAKRLRLTRSLRGQRRDIALFDRTTSTSALLKIKNQIKSRPSSDMKKKADSSGTSARLILPPITVHRYQSLVRQDPFTAQTAQHENDDTTLPNVFVTEGDLPSH